MKLTKTYNIKVLLFFILSLIGFFVISFFSNLAYDDFNYKFIYDAHGITNQRIESFSDVLVSQYHHYFVHSGRVLVHVFVQFFLLFDQKIWFDIANTLIFGISQILILKNASFNKNAVSGSVYLLLVLFLWFIIPGHNYCMFWLSGSVNYLWSVTSGLALFYVHKRSIVASKVSIRTFLLFFFVGLFLNAIHEVVSLAIVVAFVFYLIANRKCLNKNTFALTIGAIISATFTAISPANFKMAVVATSSSAADLSIQTVMASNESHIFIALIATQIFTLLALSGVLIYLFQRTLFYQLLRENQLFVIAIIVSLTFAYSVNAFSQRAIFPATIFALVILMTIVRSYSQFFLHRSIKVTLLIGFVLLAIEFNNVVSELLDNKNAYNQMIQQIEKSGKNVTVFETPSLKKNRFVCYTGLGNESRYWLSNEALSRLFHKSYLVFLPRSVTEYLDRHDNQPFHISNTRLHYFLQQKYVLLECPASFATRINQHSVVKYDVATDTNSEYRKMSTLGFCSTQHKYYLFFHVTKKFVFDKKHTLSLCFEKNRTQVEIKYKFR